MSLPPADRPEPAAGEDAARQALHLFAATLSGETLAVAAHKLAIRLAAGHGFSRVAVGLRRGGALQVEAVSNLAADDPQSPLLQLLAGAMEEALEQGSTLALPGSELDAAVITVEHAALRRQVGASVATVPLAVHGQPLGAVSVERQGGAPIGGDELQQLEQMLGLAAPVLHLMQRAERRWPQRLKASLRGAVQRLREPEQRGWRRGLAALAALLLVLVAAPFEHRVGGRARVEGELQRVLVAPVDGFLKTAHVRAGDRVASGAALVDLVEADLRLEQERWASQLAQHENAYAAAMARSDRTQASISLARIGEAQAQLSLVGEQLSRSRLTAPFDGVVIQGDLSQSIGAPVRQGDPLLTLATTDAFRVVIEIDEFDIAAVRPGQRGVLALSSLPWDTQDIVVERITPLAKAVDGGNVFEVQARLARATDEIRPGLQGRAKLVVGRAPPLWAWSRPLLQRARLALWAGVL